MPLRRRNPYAGHPLMHKGGPHQRSRSGQRQGLRQELEMLLDDWLEQAENEGEGPQGDDEQEGAVTGGNRPFSYPLSKQEMQAAAP